jgi:hypothetical protein
MLGIASFAVNSVLTYFIGYHILKYGKGEAPLTIIGIGYAVVVILCALLLLMNIAI